MASLLATVGAYTSSGLLLVSGIEHAAGAARFRGLVAKQAVWPTWAVAPVALAVTALELGVGFLGLASGLLAQSAQGLGRAGPTILLAAAALYLALGTYAVVLLRRRPGVPCACSSTDHPVNLWVPIRALVLMAGAAYAAANVAGVLPGSRSTEFLVGSLASACFVVLAWCVPTALGNPAQSPSRRGAHAAPSWNGHRVPQRQE